MNVEGYLYENRLVDVQMYEGNCKCTRPYKNGVGQ